MNTITLTLDLPPRELSPNHQPASRGGRMGKAAKTKAYRRYVAMVALAALGRRPAPMWPAATLSLAFYFATKRRRDKDNAAASFKAGRDGLADAGIVANDCGITDLPVVMQVDKDRPSLTATISEAHAPLLDREGRA